MPVTPEGILGHTITEDEFQLLRYIDSRHFLSSSTARFTEWDSSFSTDHPDWKKRIEVQESLGEVAGAVLGAEPREPGRKILFVGASKGTIATYFHLVALRRAGILEDFSVSILDFLWEPLEVTQKGSFEVTAQAETDIGQAGTMTVAEYKERLATATMIQGNACATELPDAEYDVVVAPYLQHHMGILDKQLACEEMVRITKPGGVMLLGDLTFDYPAFCEWLAAHAVEEVPYALESFVTADEHIAMFGDSEVLARRDGSFYYSIALRRPLGVSTAPGEK
ncbi:class I SAM-dependent methyltransferase [Streptomyces sp. NBC_00441]|uniref:methyltransferase domain-containing protein n=1 Tax=Streptomyces sp. NBC_00441 TaxID=2975742 RepID=UPI002E296767|nr:methyltransferase domain-containing protein [Streptomyces sp. NBC_00441]